MTVAQIKDWLELVMLVIAFVSPIVWVLIERRMDARIDTKLAPVVKDGARVRECVEDVEARTAALEWFRDQNAQNINAIPRTVAILERLDGTLERLDSTLADVGDRVARIEGPKK